ncbi:MAG: hydroxyethylthiazole kinase [Planctomycetota bacterium]
MERGTVKTSDIFNALESMRQSQPLIHHITNWVSINDCAQITRHWGCLPVMAHSIDEVAEMARLSGALVLNIGTLTVELVDAMIAAGQAANEKGIPVVLDAVGVGATSLRTRKAQEILRNVKVGILKGNAGEIGVLAGLDAEVKGVEAISVAGDIVSASRSLAGKTGAIVVVTGSTDYISDTANTWAVSRGHEIMGRVVGTGCISSSTVGCFAAVCQDAFRSTALAMTAFAIAGEQAAMRCKGPGDFIQALFNTIPELANLLPAEEDLNGVEAL